MKIRGKGGRKDREVQGGVKDGGRMKEMIATQDGRKDEGEAGGQQVTQ